MLKDITYEKVEQVIALAEEAAREPPSDPTAVQRRPITRDPPLRPQPATDWRSAFRRYLAELPDDAVVELEALYRSGSGEFKTWGAAVAAARERPVPPPQRADYLASRPNLAASLRRALGTR